MAKSIDEVLNKEEMLRIEEIKNEVTDISQARIIDNVSHIECNAFGCSVKVATYTSVDNPYLHTMKKSGVRKIPQRMDENELFEKRKNHADVLKGDRHKIMIDELHLRSHDIDVHKYFLSERMQWDVGWFYSTAHWLVDISTEFYDLSSIQHKKLGIDFDWKAMERAVVIAAPNSCNKPNYVFAMKRDELVEDLFAQYAGGVVDAKSQQADFEKARLFREHMDGLCKKYFCLLDSKK
jgi:hypothetical protein